jgi:hypothetical protein
MGGQLDGRVVKELTATTPRGVMTITSVDAVFYTLMFVVPGFVGYSVFSILVPGRATDASLLRFFTFSCYNYALWAGPIYWAISRGLPAKWPIAPP